MYKGAHQDDDKDGVYSNGEFLDIEVKETFSYSMKRVEAAHN